MCHPARLPVERLLVDCLVRRTRRSGPGGQHRNKVETAIVIEHVPTGVRGEASERRSQSQNREQAIHRLRVRLALEIRGLMASAPTSVWQQRVVGGRLSISSRHADFPALLSEALDVVASHEFEIPPAAAFLRVNSSQLVKLLRVNGDALAIVNRKRQALGKPPLR